MGVATVFVRRVVLLRCMIVMIWKIFYIFAAFISINIDVT